MNSDILKPILIAGAALLALLALHSKFVSSRPAGDAWTESSSQPAVKATVPALPPLPPSDTPPGKLKPPRPRRRLQQTDESDASLSSTLTPPKSQAVGTRSPPLQKDAALPEEYPIPATIEEAKRFLQAILDSTSGSRHRAIEELGKAIAMMTGERNEAVSAALELVADDWLRRRFLNGYLYQLGHDDPTAALAFAEAVEDDLRINSTRSTSRLYGKSEALSAAVRGWANGSLNEVRDWVDALENGSSRNIALAALGQEWSVQDMEGALSWAEGMVESENARWLLTQIASRHASSDLEGALDYFSGIEPGTTRDVYLQGIITRWAISSPEEAMKAVSTTTSLSTAQNMARQVLHYWARKAPGDAMQWVEDSATEATYTRDIQAVVHAWAQTAPDAALEYADSVADAQQRERLTRTVIAEMGRRKPAEALDVLGSLADSSQRDSLEESILTQWAKRDPGATADWVTEMGNADRQHVATGNLMLQWGAKDTAQAVQWTRQLPVGATRNAAVLAIAAANQSFTDRKDLAEWQKLIRDPELPAATVRELLQESALPYDLLRTLQSSL
ncbi:MAG: hypothetical protein HN742_37885 [Lentisphaerae bacterium]|jgi:hypothetical protein|nr:hypothetical protein [Lentisphaerota bacterium]MBT4821516.1 hypothetical protein [Lentisphaerota bacterium]MBT5608123.1 hypothetical protein [Lentisphaerota bacterium]MBT7060600.1 hypothetical protein [Lentisphaerota bacterium]MBT7847699.1 hypothetical protein [Lentisphaerota bacterium]